MEMTVAAVASAVLLAGLGSVMMIARQVAYTPSAAMLRTESAEAVNQIAEELRYATSVIQQSSRILEFVVADRNGDGTAEKIRYEWSGVAGEPLYKKVNSAAAVAILDSVNDFNISLQQTARTTSFTSTNESAEAILVSNAASPSGSERAVTNSQFTAQRINTAAFSSVPANAISWNATKLQFYGDERSSDDGTLLVQLRSTGDPNNGPTSQVLGERSVAEASLSDGWNTITFASPVRNLSLNRYYAIAWLGQGIGEAADILYSDVPPPSGVLESSDGGASWSYISNRQVFYRLYGTYTTPGTTYTVTRNYVSHVSLLLQAGTQSHARIDARVPLGNLPELLSSHWRADFNTTPTATNANGDAVVDWSYTGSGSFNAATLVGGVWYASGAIETRPLSDFTTTTIVESRCRNTTVGGNGAVVRINADREGGQYAPLLVYVQRQSDGSQTLTLSGKTSDAVTKQLFTCANLPSDFIRFRLTILPQSNVVNLTINEEDQGTFTYPTYTPSSTSDRYLTLFADTSQAEFDYIDVRAAE